MLPDDGGRTARPFVHDPAAYAILAASIGLEADAFEREITARAAFLEGLADRGICDPPSVAEAIRTFQVSTDPGLSRSR
jgi:hypothetical protein